MEDLAMTERKIRQIQIETIKAIAIDIFVEVPWLIILFILIFLSSKLFFCFLRLIEGECVETMMMGVRTWKQSTKQTFSCVMLRFLQLAAYFVVTTFTTQIREIFHKYIQKHVWGERILGAGGLIW